MTSKLKEVPTPNLAETEDHFELVTVTPISDIVDGKVKTIGTSDFTIQGKPDEVFAQFKFSKPKGEVTKIIAEPGVVTLTRTMGGLQLTPFELKDTSLLDSVINTVTIKKQASQFFNNLHVYDELDQPKLRNILLYSEPGCGKSSTINRVCLDLIKEDSGTLVINWDTSSIDSGEVVNFFSTKLDMTKKISRAVLIIEDIGGGEVEYSDVRAASSSLLSLLDGNSLNFPVPTFIIATTNYPANLLKSLADRPGRFDELIELLPPSPEERLQLAEFFEKKPLTEEQKNALLDARLSDKDNELSVAHVREIVIRSRLTGKSYPTIVQELLDHKERITRGFGKNRSVGF